MKNQKIRTVYSRRKARPLSEGQKYLLDNVFPKIQIDDQALPANFPEEVIFEIGFGSGENLVHQAKKHPKSLCIGCEPFINGIVSLLKQVQEAEIKNILVYANDAKLLLNALPDQLILKTFILFPDPWPKKRHYKRRMVCLENLLLIHRKMKKGGEIVIATDHPGYLEWVADMCHQEAFKRYFQVLASVTARPTEDEIPQTKYEKKALEKLPGTFLKFKVI